MKWAIEASGNTIIERNSEGTPVKELQNVEDLISYGVDAILIETTDGGVGQQACKLANEAGIPIFLVDCSVNEGEGKPDGQVEVNQYEYGIMAANYIIDNDLSGDFVVIGGIAGLPGNEQQQAGFLETIANDPMSFDENYEWHVRRVSEIYHILNNHGIQYSLEFIGPVPLKKSFKYPFFDSIAGVLCLKSIKGTSFWLCMHD